MRSWSLGFYSVRKRKKQKQKNIEIYIKGCITTALSGYWRLDMCFLCIITGDNLAVIEHIK